MRSTMHRCGPRQVGSSPSSRSPAEPAASDARGRRSAVRAATAVHEGGAHAMSLTIHSKLRSHRRAYHSNVVTSVAFAPDGRSLASGSWDGTIKLWDIRDGSPRLTRTFRGEWDEVEAIAF